eukprot:gene8959-13872_t
MDGRCRVPFPAYLPHRGGDARDIARGQRKAFASARASTRPGFFSSGWVSLPALPGLRLRRPQPPKRGTSSEPLPCHALPSWGGVRHPVPCLSVVAQVSRWQGHAGGGAAGLVHAAHVRGPTLYNSTDLDSGLEIHAFTKTQKNDLANRDDGWMVVACDGGRASIFDWTVDDVRVKLASCRWAEPGFRQKLRVHKVDGMALAELTKEDLRDDFRIGELGTIKALLRNITRLKDPAAGH